MKKFVLGMSVALFGVAGAFADASALTLLYPFNSADPVGTGWTQSMAPNDDGSSAQIPLPFTFCFYETDKTAVYINNNGNVSFSAPFPSFTSTGFPVNGFDMIAPFWADVDTRNRANGGVETNLVWHQFFDSSTDVAGLDTLVVTWDAVGWYNQQNGQRNTFQLAISADPDQFGSSGSQNFNTAFSYGIMDWTTGQASGGGPFGGTPATVGINNGNGVDFSQFGRFDHAGFDYDGFDGNPDGVDYLEFNDIFFDACQGIVPEPASLSLLALGALSFLRRR